MYLMNFPEIMLSSNPERVFVLNTFLQKENWHKKTAGKLPAVKKIVINKKLE